MKKDQELWSQFLAGNDRAYTQIYKNYVDKLFSYGMRFSSDRELVKDCIQDVFVKIYSNRKRLNHTDNIKLYLYIALKHTLFNVFNKDKSFYQIDTIEPVFNVEYSVEDRIIADEQEEEQKKKINQMLDSLTPRQKEVIYYRYVEGMEMDMICQLMNMNYQSVQNLIQRSIKKVRSLVPEKNKSKMSIKIISRCS
jgi:RNA polymerase sigma factor (sigma-70 family)